MNQIDPIEIIRRNPEMHFKGGMPNAIELVERIIGDALLSGVMDCSVLNRDGWWIIGSSKDWMMYQGHKPSTLFSQVVAWPEAGINSMRSEVLLTAFAKRIVLRGPDGGIELIGGDVIPNGFSDLNKGAWHRVVAFQI